MSGQRTIDEASQIGRKHLYAALVVVAALFCLPPKLFSESVFAGIIVTIFLAYFAMFSNEILRIKLPMAQVLIAALAALILVLSLLEAFKVSGHIFERDRILPQAAGLVLVLMLMPIFAHASAQLFGDRFRPIVFLVLVPAILVSVLFLQPDENILSGKGLYGAQSPAPFLQFLYFLLVTRMGSKPLRILAILLPLPLLGASSNVVIQLGLAALIVLERPSLVLTLSSIALALIVAVVTYPPSMLEPYFANDPNMLVRSHLWKNALPDVWESPLGIGYGTSWLNRESLSDPVIWRFYAASDARGLVLANHSSLIDITLRLGWVGFVLVVALTLDLWKAAKNGRFALLAAAVLVTGMTVAVLNPAVESVRSAIFIGFALGFLRMAGTSSAYAPQAEPQVAPPAHHRAAALPQSPAERRKLLAAQLTPRAGE